MEIKQKLTLQFTILVASLLVAILCFNYYQSFVFAKESFLERLKERATTLATVHLEEDKKNQNKFDLMDKKYNPGLQEESITIFDKNMKIRYFYGFQNHSFSSDFLARLKKKGSKPIEENAKTFIGLPFTDANDSFFIVASAVDYVGAEKLKHMVESMVVSFFIFLIFVVLAGHYLAKKALEPIQSVIFQVKSISANNLHERVAYENNKDEIAQLSSTFNSMLERLENDFLRQMAFVSNASHELRNPLAAMIGQAEITLMKERENSHYKDVLETIFSDALRLKKIVNSLLQLSQASADSKSVSTIRLDEMVLDIIENLTRTKGYRQIEILLPEEMGEELLVKGNPSLLEVGIGNLIDNACKYSDGKEVICSIEKDGKDLLLVVEDHGLGMSELEMKYCLDPFYRSESARKKEGFGIGLAVSNSIFKSHGVDMQLSSQPGKGTRIQLRFPFAVNRNR